MVLGVMVRFEPRARLAIVREAVGLFGA